ncbi:MAG: SDR family NAD(P)-dependent oxidoreductase [Pseudomonadota bacterium]|nr:SDR family NAD(P)-dependent oxidoreductase [Pseudomonadota bacterium]
MTEHIFIVTGASRGLGAALTEQLLAPANALLCIARANPAERPAEAAARGARVEQWNVDLVHAVEVAARVQAWLTAFDPTAVASATLVNNAAMLTRIGPIEACNDAEISASLRVSLEAPLLLTAAFLRATRDWSGRRRILNISSGLGRRAMAGTAVYCAAKAAMDHCSRAIALDEAGRKNGARIVSLAPGVIDTGMQVQLRTADPAGFPEQAVFTGLKAKGQLTSSAEAASRVLAFLERPDFGENVVADVRDA